MDRMGGPTGKAESQAGALPATSSGPAPLSADRRRSTDRPPTGKLGYVVDAADEPLLPGEV